jgi:hypothetical protein
MTGNLNQSIDRPKALRLCEQDAINGYAYAQYLVAWISAEEGRMLDASLWMRRSAAQGFPPALFDMGRFYLNGIGVRKDRQLAKGWLWKAVRSGHVIALRVLLQQYRAGWHGSLRKIVAKVLWPLSGPYLYIFVRLAGPNNDRFFFYNWPKVGKDAEPDGR